MAKQLVAPEYYVNDTLIALIPNSYKSTVSAAQINTRVAVAGKHREVLRGVDHESNFDKHTMQIPYTDVNKNLVKEWKRQSEEGNYFVCKAIFPDADRADDVLKYASLDNMIEGEASADGNIELEFTGLSSGE